MDSVAPTRRGARFRFESSGVGFEVDADRGGRIVEFSLDGRNMLFEAAGDSQGNDGSTFWTSPQAAWSWPPPPEIDREPFEVRRTNDGRVCVVSRPSAVLGLSVQKDFTVALDGAVTIEYRITNESSEKRSAAPWEVTRVPRSGVSFFPRGGMIRRSPRVPAPAYSETNGLVWIEHTSCPAEDRKLHAEGPGGWLAHADAGLLFVKSFESVAREAQAPDEAMVEIFVSGGAPYVELEEQGAYQQLGPRESLEWRVVWRLASLQGHQQESWPQLESAVSELLKLKTVACSPKP